MQSTTPARTGAAAPLLPSQQGTGGSSTWLHQHLVRDHGRAPHELAGVPLEDVHRLEHVDQVLSLLQLGHRHASERDGS